MRNQELGLDGVVCLEVTAAVAEQVVHEQTVWTLLEACLEDLGDRDHLVDRKKMAQTVVRERIHSSAVEGPGAWSEVGLVQMSPVVFAALVHGHCLLEAPHLLALVANRCYFVGSSHGPERTAPVERYILLRFNGSRIHELMRSGYAEDRSDVVLQICALHVRLRARFCFPLARARDLKTAIWMRHEKRVE